MHEHGCTITREHGRWVFRDPRGRVIGDPGDVLNEQLDLLRPHSAAPDLDNDQVTATIATVMADMPGRYDTATWGWPGQHPDPLPGHGPPRRAG